MTQPTAAGQLTIYPSDQTLPGTTTIAFSAGRTHANNTMLLLSSDGRSAVKIYNNSTGTVHVIIDVNGYFQ